MDSLLVVFGGMMLFLVLFAVALGLWHPRTGVQIVGRSLRDYGAEAEIEEHDIDQMVEAYNELRRRGGRPELGDELAKQLEGHLRDG